MHKALGHLCINIKTQNLKNRPLISPARFPVGEKQSRSGARSGSAGRLPADTRPRRCPLAGPAGPVTSACPRLPPRPGPLPASRPRISPPRLRRRRGRHWRPSAPEGPPLAGWEVTRPAHSAALRLAGKLPYYCDAENGETPSRAGGAVTVGIPSGGSAAAEVRGSGPGFPGRSQRGAASARPRVPPGRAVRARLPEGLLGLLRLQGRSPRRPGAARAGRSGRGGCGACGARAAGLRRAGRARCPSASRAPPRRSRGLPWDRKSPRAQKGRKQP